MDRSKQENELAALERALRVLNAIDEATTEFERYCLKLRSKGTDVHKILYRKINTEKEALLNLECA